MEETEEQKENKMFKQMMDLEQKIKANEIMMHNFCQNIDEVWKVHKYFKTKLMSI